MSLIAHMSFDRAQRYPLDRIGTLRDDSDSPSDVVLDNLSHTGCFIAHDADLPIGTIISLGIAGSGVHLARVTRRDGDGYGCEFMAPMSDAQLSGASEGGVVLQGDFQRFLPPEPMVFDAAAEPAELSLRQRTAIIAGSSLLLWGVCIVAIIVIRAVF